MSDESTALQLGADEIQKIIDMQIRRDIDPARALAFWKRALAGTPVDVLAAALTQALSYEKYRPARRCGCCCAR